MRRLYFILATLLIGTFAALAQERTVSGEVVSAADGDPLVGATVYAPGSNKGTTTDIEGKFKLTLPREAKKLQVSYVGMTTLEVDITGEFLHIELDESSTLSEVVVTGYGVTKKAAFTGAASVVDGSVIEKRADVNLVKGLEGNVTGFQYNNSTSMPGAWGSVYVRGMGSLSSSSTPLYVVDGVPVNSDPDYMSSNNNYFDPMAAFNPSDIESVTVLKDAAATAIYGSRAANGVIIITTKKGAQGRFELNIDVKQGFTAVANNNMKYADAFGMHDLLSRGYAARTGKPIEECREIIADNFEWDGVSSYDWLDAVRQKGYFQDYNISFAGTSGKTNYFVSLGYIDTEGVIINSGNERYSGRVNLDTKYQHFSAGINASYSYSKNHNFSQSTGGSMANPQVGAVSQMTPFYPIYNPDGTYWGVGSYYNPVAVNDAELGDLNQTINETIVANPWLKVDLPLGIWVKTNFGMNIMNQDQYNYWSGVYNNQGIGYNGLGMQYNSRTSTLTWTNTLGWNYTFNDKNSIDLMLGQEMQRYEYHSHYYSRYDFPFCVQGMRDMATAAVDNGSEYYRSQSRLASYFADAHYSYDERYFLSASYRRDGSSVFGTDNRWGNFWSVGAKWRFSNESFLKNQTWLTNSDLRISYGTVGNQSLPSLYAARGYYQTGYNYDQTPGMVPVQISNPDLSWETSKKFDIGFDLGFFNRANLTFDFYSDTTDDALYQVPISLTTGMANYYKNIGRMRNTGIEIGVNGTVYTDDKVTVNAFVNMTWNRNRVIKLFDEDKIENTWNVIEVGHPYRQYYMPEYAGVDRETGKALYYLNAEGDELTDVYAKAAKRYVGQADPKVFGAFGVNAKGWGFDLSLQFNYRAGNKVFDTGHAFTGWVGSSLRTPLQTMVDNSWTPENPDALYPQYIYGDPYYVAQNNNSTRWLMDGSYIRLSNIALGYTLPRQITRKALMQKVRFYINLDNVHTWTKKEFIGYNPDTYANGQIAWQYPAVFTFTGGVQVTF